MAWLLLRVHDSALRFSAGTEQRLRDSADPVFFLAVSARPSFAETAVRHELNAKSGQKGICSVKSSLVR